MADQAISALVEVTAPAASDIVPIVNSATTKKVQIQNLVKLGNVAIWARVFHSTTQSISDSTVTVLSFNSERYDTDVIHDNATNNSRLTCKTAGVYSITAQVGFATNATGVRIVNIRLNGSTTLASNSVPAASGFQTRITAKTEYALAVNDYVEAIVFQTSGGALNTEQAANYSPEFMMIRLGA